MTSVDSRGRKVTLHCKNSFASLSRTSVVLWRHKFHNPDGHRQVFD